MANTIYHHQDFRKYLSTAKKSYGDRKKEISLSAWAKKLGYKSKRSLGMVLDGSRLPSPSMITVLAKDLRLSQAETRYFELLVLKEKTHDAPKESPQRRAVEEELEILSRTPRKLIPLSLDYFALIKKWYFFPLMLLIQTSEFRFDLKWISKRLRGKATPTELEKAIDTLIELKIIAHDQVTNKVNLLSEADFAVPTDIPSRALQEHHKEMMKRAAEAFDEQMVTEREFNTLTLRLNKKSLPQIKSKIRNFINEFDDDFEDLESDDVFQLNVQFFRITD